jgi:hypothetical protein
MIAVGHTSVGVLVGLAGSTLLPAEAPLWLLVVITGVAGVASHYVMDLVPHGHYQFDGKTPSRRSVILLSLDLGLPIIIIAIILLAKFGLGPASWLVAAGVAGAQAPDIFDGLLDKGLIPAGRLATKESTIHYRTHWHNPTDPTKATPQGGIPLGLADMWQGLVAAIALLWLLTY